ncbi:aspartate kinase [Alicyclobacillus ferrooxydans]|uniref:Aspartokinase n=1 Tax=Alicyclobacillus ferrooxydans TaxID=471514 RepID=A0A0P9CP08_9BACL|nr:aspartate kinase [Alicyclobacillus ferrooxydans]KPV44590.1 hypothetical protein AN477_06230 [Alicyclobacillus ferrooxydans]
MKVLVQKFGGTSVQSAEVRRQAAEHVVDAVDEGYRVVVVVSAMGRKGNPYATDELLGLVESGSVDDRDLDVLLSCGEAISAVVFSSELGTRGLGVTVLNGNQAGILTDDQYGDARIQSVQTERLRMELEKHDVVIVMGFQGYTEDGNVTTLGRGGSDTTAAALGTALDADRVEIFSDVNGVLTADPRLVEHAALLPQLTYTEACSLAWEGARVIHPRAVEVAMQNNTPMVVRNTRNHLPGTRIVSSLQCIEDSKRCNGTVIGITYRTDLVQVSVGAVADAQQVVFRAVADCGVQPGFVLSSPMQVSFTLPAMHADSVAQSLTQLGQHFKLIHDCARVSVVGTKLDEISGLMGSILETLVSKNIEVLQSADYQSTIRLLVRKSDMESAVCELHNKLIRQCDDVARFPLTPKLMAGASLL